jgi:hypothetical protein
MKIPANIFFLSIWFLRWKCFGAQFDSSCGKHEGD